MKLTHYTVGNEGSMQEEVQYTEGSVQDEELVTPENKRIKSSSTATTPKQKTSDNTKIIAINYLLHIFWNFAQFIAT